MMTCGGCVAKNCGQRRDAEKRWGESNDSSERTQLWVPPRSALNVSRLIAWAGNHLNSAGVDLSPGCLLKPVQSLVIPLLLPIFSYISELPGTYYLTLRLGWNSGDII